VKITQLITNFSGGELSAKLRGRSDVRKYGAGCRVLQNAIVVPAGGARKRPGTRFVIEQRSATEKVLLVEYQNAIDAAYILMFGPNYVWFFRDQSIITQPAKTITGVTQANPAVVTSTAHGYANGDKVLIGGVVGMTELNNRWFTVAGATANTFQLSGVNSTGYNAYASAGTARKIVELVSPFGESDLSGLQFVAIRDVVYIQHPSYQLRKLSRFSDTIWTFSIPDITTGPFRPINGDETLRLRPAVNRKAITGVNTSTTVVVTSPAHGFVVGDKVLITSVVATQSGGGGGGGGGGGAGTGGEGGSGGESGAP